MTRITRVDSKPLLLPLREPYHWAQGVTESAFVVLLSVSSDENVVGYGECIATPVPRAILSYLDLVAPLCIGRSPFELEPIWQSAFHRLSKAAGTGNQPRLAAQVLAGLDMALWDLAGKLKGLAVCELFGGALREEVEYFGFAQGASPDRLAADAKNLAGSGHAVIYIKAGAGDGEDLERIASVRRAIGPDTRLRVDPNEHWSPARTQRLLPKLAALGVEMIEQPVNAESHSALAQVHAHSPIAISADQSVFTHYDAFDICRQRAADLIVIGLHEAGSLSRLRKVAAVAEAAGIDICLHGVHETGVTTCAAMQVAATIANLDDGNQIMTGFLERDIIRRPSLSPVRGKLPVSRLPGLGFELDEDAVADASECFARAVS